MELFCFSTEQQQQQKERRGTLSSFWRSEERGARGEERRANVFVKESKKQKGKMNTQHTHSTHSTHNTQPTTHPTQHTPLNTPHSTHPTQHSTHPTQHTTLNTPHSTHNTQPTPHNPQPAYNMSRSNPMSKSASNRVGCHRFIINSSLNRSVFSSIRFLLVSCSHTHTRA